MPYRDELSALRSREEAVRRDLAGKQQELDEIRKTLEGLRPRFRLRVASPCWADWNRMQGDDRARFCEQCQKNVYNLSAMTHADAKNLILEKEGNLCIRFYQRPDGTVLTADCPVGKRRKRRRRVAIAVSAAGLMVTAAAYAATTRTVEPVMSDAEIENLIDRHPLQGKFDSNWWKYHPDIKTEPPAGAQTRYLVIPPLRSGYRCCRQPNLVHFR